MKLHLPKLLLTAVLAVCASPVALAETYTITGNDDTRLDSATSTDTIIFNKDGGHLYRADGQTYNGILYPQIEVEAAVQIDKLKLTDAYSNSFYTFKNTVSGSGEFSFSGSTGGNNQHYIFEGDMSDYTGTMTIASNKTAEFIFKGIEVGATKITGANVQFTDGASTSATIDINSGKLLILGHEGTGSYGGFQSQSVDLSGATVNLNGGTIRFNGDDSFLGTLNVKQNGTLRLEDSVSGGTNSSGTTAGRGLNITTLNLESDLNVTNRWKATLDIATLKGTGSVTFNADNNETVKVKVNSIAKGAVIRSNAAILTLGDNADSVINLSDTMTNTGSVSVKGELNFDTDSGKFKVYDAGTFASYTFGNNGFKTSTGAQLYAFQGAGSVTIEDTATIKQGDTDSSLQSVEGGLVFSVAGEYTDKTIFYVNEGGVTAGEGDCTEATGFFGADTYVLGAGTSLDVNGSYFAGKTFELGAGATLKNSGAGLDGNKKMFAGIVLNGDATVDAGSNMGLQNMTSADASVTNTTLVLNGNTLTKSGSSAFFLTSTQVADAGTIKITSGTLQVGIEVGQCLNADTNASQVHFELAGGTLNLCRPGNKLTGLSLAGNGTVSGTGVLQLENTGTAASHTITGNVKVGALYLLGKDSYTINGNLTVSGAEDGYARIKAANLTLGSGTHSINRLDLSDGSKSNADMVLNSGAHLTVGAAANGAMWMGDDASLTVKNGASFSVFGVKTEAKNSTTDAEITFLATSDDSFGLTNSNYQFKDAKVSYAAAAEGSTLGIKLLNSELVNTGSGTLTASHTGNVLSGIDASAGNIDVINAKAQTLSSLIIGEGKTVGLYTGNAVPATPASDNEATVTISSLEVKGTGATLNANLVLANGATVKMAEALTMGSTVRLGTGMTLSGDLVSTIKTMSEDGIVDLFTGVDALYLGDSTVASGALDATSGEYLNTYFNFDDQRDYYLGYSDGKVYAGVISVPEPTTATLSLLALAALASRRRRK